VASPPWDQRLGNHRARVRVTTAAAAVRVHLPWRRRDPAPEAKAVWVTRAGSSERLRNVACVALTREAGDLVFQAAEAGEYHVYYLPFRIDGTWFPSTVYDAPDATADAAWLAAHGLDAAGLAAGTWRALPEAEVVGFQARTEFDRMDPMELIATGAEMAALKAAHPDSACLLFPEDRRFPIRMTTDLPQRWLEQGPAARFAGEACRNEFYVFQIGLYAAAADIGGIELEFGDLRAGTGAAIAAGRLRCFNTGGRDWLGRPFAKDVRVPQGQVQALWLGVDVPDDATPGVYEGRVAVRPAGAEAVSVQVSLRVTADRLADRGDAELWRLSRLRWLDSTIGSEEEVTRPYTPLAVDDRTVVCLGRSVRFGGGGLPTSIQAPGGELLAEPVRFIVEAAGAPLPFAGPPARVMAHSPATVSLESEQQTAGASLSCRATMEFDGFIHLAWTLRADRDLELTDCRLEVPLKQAFATYMMGLGCKGGRRPETWQWRWDVRKYQDSLWVGDVEGGLQLKLKGPNYRRPLGNIHYHRQPLLIPEAWFNEGRGEVVLESVGEAVVVRARSGPRRLAAGQELHFDADLLVTPVKPLDLAAHCRQRYYHSGVPDPAEVVAKGANVINLHHANHLNPFINYPFLRTAELGDYVRKAHDAGARVKLYYTIRELTNHVAELWALRSLGTEIYVDGNGGGHAWLHEHLVDHYAPAWHTPLPEGEWCCSISQTGLSRWHNYYLEGLAWLCGNLQIDGLYLDEIGYDREIMKRVRRVLDRQRPGALLDLHSWNHFNDQAGWANCLNLYLEHLPYVDSLWIGEGRNYDEGPDHWLVEASGIPFGLFSEMLEGGGNPWRGMLYAMTNRLPYCGDPTPLWKLWDDFGLADAEMLGYWSAACPVRTDRTGVLATVYRRPGRSLVCLASWEPEIVQCALAVDWQALGLDPARAVLYAPPIAGLQSEDLFWPGEAVPVEPRSGWIFLLDETPRPAPHDHRLGRQVLCEDDFAGPALQTAWTVAESARPGTSIAVKDGCLTIECTANTCAYLERPLPPGTRLVECRLNSGTDGGQTWGIGLGLAWPERFLRVHLRAEDRRFGYDDTGEVSGGPAATPGTWQQIRIRLEESLITIEGAQEAPRPHWRTIATFPRTRFPGDPVALRVGKTNARGTLEDFPEPGEPGVCRARDLRVYGDAPVVRRQQGPVTLFYSPESEALAGPLLDYAVRCNGYLAQLFGAAEPVRQTVHWLARRDWRGKAETYGFPYASGPDAFLPAADVDLPTQLALCTDAMDIPAGGEAIQRLAALLGLPADHGPTEVYRHLSGAKDFFVTWTAWQILPHELTHGYANALGYPQQPRWWYEGLAQWAAYQMQRQLRSAQEAEAIYQYYQLLWERAGDRLKVRDFAEADRLGAGGLDTPNYAWYHAGLLRLFRRLEESKGAPLLPDLVRVVGTRFGGRAEVTGKAMMDAVSEAVGRDLHEWFAREWQLPQ
jgi:hypothetical protein